MANLMRWSRLCVSRRWEAPFWVDCMGPQSRDLYARYFRPLVGFNPWLELATNAGRLF